MKNYLIFIVLMFVMGSAQASQKVKNCSDDAAAQIARAIHVVQNNIETIMDNTEGMTSEEKEKMRKKVLKVHVKCMDFKPVCQNHDGRLGASRHLLKRSVVLCYNEIAEIYGSNAFCALVDTVAHEFAHTASVEKEDNHNDGPNNDRVYRLGDAAEDFCNFLRLNRALPLNTEE